MVKRARRAASNPTELHSCTAFAVTVCVESQSENTREKKRWHSARLLQMWPLYWHPLRLRHVSVGTSRGTLCCTGKRHVGSAGEPHSARTCTSTWIIVIHFSQPSHHSTTTMLKKLLIYRNTDGADGLSRRNEDTIKKKNFWKPQYQGLETRINIEMHKRTTMSLTWKASRSFPLKSMMSEEPAVPFSPG